MITNNFFKICPNLNTNQFKIKTYFLQETDDYLILSEGSLFPVKSVLVTGFLRDGGQSFLHFSWQ